MGGLVSGITDAIGLTNTKGEKQAAAAAASATAAGQAMSQAQIDFAKEQLQFQKDQYKDFTDVYGDLQTNLSAYFKTLTPEKVTSLGLENQQKEFQAADTAIKRDFAQRGLSNSGEELQATTENTIANSVARAGIRANADNNVVAAKEAFLGIGLGQGTQELATIANSAGTVNSAYSTGVGFNSNTAASYLGRANTLGTQNLQNMNDIAGTITGHYLK